MEKELTKNEWLAREVANTKKLEISAETKRRLLETANDIANWVFD